jgi:4a-hydroxytetrahydrobiopterin dehydratase
MAKVALVAEKMDHHPDWKNVYNRVDVELVTHDAAGITDNDFDLAARMNELSSG